MSPKTYHTPETSYNTIATLLTSEVGSLGALFTDGRGHNQYGTNYQGGTIGID